MARQFYCSKCGIELIHSRKAVPGRGVILDLIDPHECEGYAIKSDKFDSPTVKDLLEKMPALGATTEAKSQERHTGFRSTLSDRRGQSSSTAPKSLIDNIKSMETSDDEEAEV
jgi:hypothetical protein